MNHSGQCVSEVFRNNPDPPIQLDSSSTYDRILLRGPCYYDPIFSWKVICCSCRFNFSHRLGFGSRNSPERVCQGLRRTRGRRDRGFGEFQQRPQKRFLSDEVRKFERKFFGASFEIFRLQNLEPHLSWRSRLSLRTTGCSCQMSPVRVTLPVRQLR